MAFRELRGDARRRPDGRATGSRSTSSSGGSRAGCARSSSTRSRTTRTRPASASRPSGASALVELARRYGFLIVEDVAYRELGFDDEALPSLWSLAPDVVVQAGTTSKTFFPGVRLGWAVGPAEIVRAARLREAEHRPVRRRARPAAVRGVRPPRLDRRAARAVARALPAQVRAAARRARALDAGRRALDAPQGGFFSWLTLPGGVDSADLARARGRAGRRHRPRHARSSRTAAARDNVRLSFSMVDEAQIDDGIERLASLVSA